MSYQLNTHGHNMDTTYIAIGCEFSIAGERVESSVITVRSVVFFFCQSTLNQIEPPYMQFMISTVNGTV